MGKWVRSAIVGPFPFFADQQTPPPGWSWVRLTCIKYKWIRKDGKEFCLPLPYLKKLPMVSVPKPWEHFAEIEKMIDEAGDKQKPSKWEGSTDPFITTYPTINRYCTDFWWEKPVVKPRTPCTLAIQFFSGTVQVSINDKEKRRSMHTTSTTVAEALQLMEDHLAAGNAPWRDWGGQGGKQK